MDDREVKEVRTRLERTESLAMTFQISRDVVRSALAKPVICLDDLFTPKEREMVRTRIDALARLDLIGHEMANSIRENRTFNCHYVSSHPM